MTIALVDADIFVFRAALAVEYIAHWSRDLSTLHSSIEQGIPELHKRVDEVTEALGVDRVVFALSSSDYNFRKRIMPTYKANRKEVRKPIIIGPLNEYLAQEYEVYERPGLEGDDVLGILQTHPKFADGEETIVISLDKDMGSIPGPWLNNGRAQLAMSTPEGKNLTYRNFVRNITVERADRMHMEQTIAGDPTDGYPGVPGFGMTNAAKLLDTGRVLEQYEHTITRGERKGQKEMRGKPGRDGTPWEIVVSAYEVNGLTEHDALLTAQVARICRNTDWDYEKGEVILWEPPNN